MRLVVNTNLVNLRTNKKEQSKLVQRQLGNCRVRWEQPLNFGLN